MSSAEAYNEYLKYKEKEEEYKTLANKLADKINDISGYEYCFDDITKVFQIMNNSRGEDTSYGVMISDFSTAMEQQITSYQELKTTMQGAINGIRQKLTEAQNLQESFRQKKEAAYARYQEELRREEEERRRREEEERREAMEAAAQYIRNLFS